MLVKVLFPIILISIDLTSGFNITLPTELERKIYLSINLIQNCFSDEKSILMVYSSESVIQNKLNNNFGTAISIQFSNSHQSFEPNEEIPTKSVIIAAESPAHVKKVLTNSNLRKPHRFFIILSTKSQKGARDCKYAESFLLEAWKNDVLNAIFICFERDQIPIIFAFNPYTELAPNPWQKVSTQPGINDHPWTLLSRKYNLSHKNCNNLRFEKATDIGGYLIRMAAKEYLPWVIYQSVDGNLTKCGGYESQIIKSIVKKLNATFLIYGNKNIVFESFDNTTDKGIINYLKDGQVDILFNSLFLRTNPATGVLSHVIRSSKISIMTLHRGFMTDIQKLFTFLPPYIAFSFFAISFLTLMIIRFLLKDPTNISLIDGVRIFLSTPIPRLPISNSGRFLIGSVIIAFLIIDAVIQGNFAKIFTTPHSLPNIETIQDIIDFNYTALGSESVVSMFKGYGVSRTKVQEYGLKCLELQRNYLYAGEEAHLRAFFTKHCHISKKPFTNVHQVYYTRFHWPLFSRVNQLMLEMFEGGLFQYWYKDLTVNVKLHRFSQRKPLKWKDMKSILQMFIFCLSCSVIIFLMELFIYWRPHLKRVLQHKIWLRFQKVEARKVLPFRH